MSTFWRFLEGWLLLYTCILKIFWHRTTTTCLLSFRTGCTFYYLYLKLGSSTFDEATNNFLYFSWVLNMDSLLLKFWHLWRVKNKDRNILTEENLLGNTSYPSNWKICIYKVSCDIKTCSGQEGKLSVWRYRKYSGYINWQLHTILFALDICFHFLS